MHRSLVTLGIASLGICVALASLVDAQDLAPRKYAPGVVKTIPIELNPRDTFSLPMSQPDVVAPQYQPITIPNESTLQGLVDRVILFRDNVWEYEFSFIGLRQAKLQVPTANGKLESKNFWYMVFRVRNTGATMSFDKVKRDPAIDRINHELKLNRPIPAEAIDFRPRLTLEGSVVESGKYKRVAYSDIINPILVEQIRKIEDPNQKLLDTRQMSKVKLPLAKSDADPGVWGVAIWEEVDPRIDFVSVFVRGLTNAYRLDRNLENPSKLKTLQLNFWRPGDRVGQQRDQVQYGIPLVDDPQEQSLICDRYRMAGPQLNGYEVNRDAKRNVLVVEADAQINLDDFSSNLTPVLDTGKLPPALVQAFADSGITVDQNAAVKTEIQGRKWTFSDGGNDFILQLEPRFWEPDFGKIRFIKSLDHMWIYR